MTTSIDILEHLVRFDTTSRNSNLELMDYIAAQLAAVGVTAQIIPDTTGTKANLFATIGPQDRPGILLSGHTDVVPIDGQNWTVPAFDLTQRDGRLYGRGTTDMKGFVASALHAARLAATMDLKTPLHLGFSCDEEVGCIGVRTMIDAMRKAPFAPRMCIVGEPTNMAVATGHKGKTGYHVTCTGIEGHSALAPLAVNALHLGCDFVNAVRQVQDTVAQTGATDTDYDVAYSTLHVGKMRGGVALNIVPNTCAIDFEIRNLAQDDPQELLNQIQDRARNITQNHPAPVAIDIEKTISYPGLSTPVDADAVRFVKSLTGANATCKVAFGTEGGLFSQELGIQTVVCGPGSMAQGHKPDEYITTDQMALCDQMMTRLLDRLQTGG